MRTRSLILGILLTAGFSLSAFTAFASSFAYNGSAVTFYQRYERDNTNFALQYEGKLVRLHTYVTGYLAGTGGDAGQLNLAMLVTPSDVRAQRCFDEQLAAGERAGGMPDNLPPCGDVNTAADHFDAAIDRQFCMLTPAAEAALRRTGHFTTGFYTIVGRFHDDAPGVYIHDCAIVSKG